MTDTVSDSDDIIDQLNKAEDRTKLALLASIESSAKQYDTPATLERLANAYALVVGANLGVVPSGVIPTPPK